ncbi:MAG: enoyl-CoA hydratase/isomerase family protein [Proteobacteria bacterium]|nr:enoyl-CoA hydratase/isomerase family protein [Pseudomonadota bacterium]
MYELVLDGPGKNALGSDMLRSIRDRLDAHPGEPLLLRGENGAFSAGVNLKEIAALDDAGMRAYLELLDEVPRRLFEWPAPTVAVVDGHAIAGGAIIALACDVRIAEDNPKLKIGLTEVAVGVLFPPMIWNMVNHRIPAHALNRVLLGAALVGPKKAAELGLIDEVVTDALAAGKKELARRSSFDGTVYRKTKAMLQDGVLDIDAAQAQAFADEVVPAWTSPELRARLLKALSR